MVNSFVSELFKPGIWVMTGAMGTDNRMQV